MAARVAIDLVVEVWIECLPWFSDRLILTCGSAQVSGRCPRIAPIIDTASRGRGLDDDCNIGEIGQSACRAPLDFAVRNGALQPGAVAFNPGVGAERVAANTDVMGSRKTAAAEIEKKSEGTRQAVLKTFAGEKESLRSLEGGQGAFQAGDVAGRSCATGGSLNIPIGSCKAEKPERDHAAGQGRDSKSRSEALP